MLLIGIDEAGYGPVLGPLCHGYAAIRVPDTAGETEFDLWRMLHPAVGRAGEPGFMIDDSKKLYSSAEGVSVLESGVRAFVECIVSAASRRALDLRELLPADDLADLLQDRWLECAAGEPCGHAFDCSPLKDALARNGAEVLTVGARAQSARAFNKEVKRGANKAEASWRIISSELRRLAALARPDESVFAAVDRQGGRKFYAALVGETFESALVHVECESESLSVYRIDHGPRCTRIGFYVDGDSKHLLIALSSMAAKLAREKYMQRFNAFFLQHQPGLRPTAGYYNDAQRFLDDTKTLRRRLKIADRDLIRTR